MNNPSPNPAGDLAYIRQVMAETRRAVFVNGRYFVLWGTMVLVGFLAEWFLAPRFPGWVIGILWGGVVALGWIGSFLLAHRGGQRTPATPAARLIGAVWVGCTVAMVVILFVGTPTGRISTDAAAGIAAGIAGIGVFLTGVLTGIAWMRHLAWAWWIGAGIMLAVPGRDVLLVGAAWMLFFYVVPGLILARQERRLPPTMEAGE